jgi:hypothetical protein
MSATITGTSFGSSSVADGFSRFIFIVFVSMLFVHGESDPSILVHPAAAAAAVRWSGD